MLPAYLNVNQFNLIVGGRRHVRQGERRGRHRSATIGTSEYPRDDGVRPQWHHRHERRRQSLAAPGQREHTAPLRHHGDFAHQLAVRKPVPRGDRGQVRGSTVNVAIGAFADADACHADDPRGSDRHRLRQPRLRRRECLSHRHASPRPSGACAAAATTPSSTTTDAGGIFQLPLDPGTYQLDYDPPSGSSAPRFTDPVDFVVGDSDSGQTLRHDVPLPAGGLVRGSRSFPEGRSHSPQPRFESSSPAAPAPTAPRPPGCGGRR